ncbi:MAG: hypothetical protein JWL77_1203 [Chthonomonadaceae bacterium]|nr:hypothetical protein [Chthonomonadaceae bacterium]
MRLRPLWKPQFVFRPGVVRVTTLAALACGLSGANAGAQITTSNWGAITAPVYNTIDPSRFYAPFRPELFAGPQKFTENYFWGVLPNGRKVTPVGKSVQVGMNPLGCTLTPDGKYLIVSCDDERDGAMTSLHTTGMSVNGTGGQSLRGGYSITVVDANNMGVVSQSAIATDRFFIGLQVTPGIPDAYTVWASGGGDNDVKLFHMSSAGLLAPAVTMGLVIPIPPILPDAAGYVSHYSPASNFNNPGEKTQNLRSVPSGFSGGGAKITFPAGSALSPDGKFLYVACNGDNSLAVIEIATRKVVKQIAVGYFPSSVSVSADGTKVVVSNQGVTEYKFANAVYDSTHRLTALSAIGVPAAGSTRGTANQPDGFYVPVTDTGVKTAKTSSVSIISVPGGRGAEATLMGSFYQGQPDGLDALNHVGDTHPTGTAICTRGGEAYLYVTKANSDSLGIVSLADSRRLPDVDLSPVSVSAANRLHGDTHRVHGAYPNAIVVSPDNTRAYVAEAGLNSVAVLDLANPARPKLIGRIPTGWYPTALTLSRDGKILFIVNAKGIGEDINPDVNATEPTDNHYTPNATGIESFADSNYIFGSVQRVPLANLRLDNATVLNNNFQLQRSAGLDTRVVPLGGSRGSAKIKHVVFILHENKTFDSMLGNLGGAKGHFGPFADTTFTSASGMPNTNMQYTGVARNTQLLAQSFATAVNYYSDSEESDAGHQFAASGTASDYTEKTLLVKSGRGLLVNKNFEPEDYPEGGYIFNNAARNGVSFKDYGALIRIAGTDTGSSFPASTNDPTSGNAGLPLVDVGSVLHRPLANSGDVDAPTRGLGQSYFLSLPILAVLGANNASGEPHLDKNYPGYNFNISDQRRAKEFIRDFDAMVAKGTLPQFLYLYQPNDHTGTPLQATNIGATGIQEIADGDVGLGMVVQHIMTKRDAAGHSLYYNDPKVVGKDGKRGDGTGTAIFITYDDAQSSFDHIHPHRTPLIVVSPYARVTAPGTLNKGFLGTRHYVTASIVKTEELLLGLPPNNLGDMFATDLRDLFQPAYNGITANLFTGTNSFTRVVTYTPSHEGKKIWALAKHLDSSAPDRDSRRLGALTRLSMKADDLYKTYAKAHRLETRSYRQAQANLYAMAEQLVKTPAPRDIDD